MVCLLYSHYNMFHKMKGSPTLLTKSVLFIILYQDLNGHIILIKVSILNRTHKIPINMKILD